MTPTSFCIRTVLTVAPLFITVVGWAQEATVPMPEPLAITSDELTADISGVKATARDLSAAFRSAASQAMPSVVVVLAKRSDVNETLDQLELLDDSASNFSAGSGVILTPEGLIVTNSHVVEDSNDVRVRLADGREFAASDIRRDKSSDLAILTISPPEPLQAVAVGDSSQMAVGDWVIAIGSPFLLEQTVSAGIISGKSRILKAWSVVSYFKPTHPSILATREERLPIWMES